MIHEALTDILPLVEKPARYTGGEYGSIVKAPEKTQIHMAMCYPDVYEVGMSNLGLRILYGLMNETEGVWCERAYAPWPDMREQMKNRGIALYGLESGEPLKNLHIVGFTLQYELCYTNVLDMLDLAGIPVFSAERDDRHPLVIGGGPCVYNAEPIADFFDLIWIGEAEESLPEFIALYKKIGKTVPREELLRRAAQIEGIYVPSLYEIAYHGDGTVASVTPRDGAPATVKKRVVRDLDGAYYPKTFPVPSVQIIHDRVMLEIFRGCVRGCRFCQAGHTYRPIRAKKVDTLVRQAIEQLEFSGCEEVSLASLSTSDYRELAELCDRLLEYCEPRNISLSLPSLRADNFSLELMQRVQKVRRSGLTFAPEAGTQRLRDVINKNITDEDLYNACRMAFSGGWNGVKLYYMIGLPTETDEDLQGIAEMSNRVLYIWRQYGKNRDRGVRIGVSTSSFVPKPCTPFQWCAQASPEELGQKIALLRQSITGRSVSYNWHDVRVSHLEGVFARGDRRLAVVIHAAWKAGCSFDGWDEHLKYDVWMRTFREHGVDTAFYTSRVRGETETFPWDHIDCGVSRDYLWQSYQMGLSGQTAPNCREGCGACGADTLLRGGLCDA